jgi:site-specific recombinase XerD
VKLLGQVRAALRLRHYSRRTEEAYTRWIERYVRFHGTRHPAEMGSGEVSAFLASLAIHSRVSASTQNQALAALLFLYGEVLGQKVAWVADLVRAKQPHRLPVVLTRDEVRAILGSMRGVHQVVARLLYGTGLRLLEGLSLESRISISG